MEIVYLLIGKISSKKCVEQLKTLALRRLWSQSTGIYSYGFVNIRTLMDSQIYLNAFKVVIDKI